MDPDYKYIKIERFKDKKILEKIFSQSKKYEHNKCPEYLKLSEPHEYLLSISNKQSRFIIGQIKRKSNTDGPLFLFKDGYIYPLKGACAKDIKSFSINDKMYILYVENGCDNGILIKRVYDLSGDIPKLIYSNDMST